MPYTKQTWPNAVMGDSIGARMNYVETGIATAQTTAEAASTLYLPPGVIFPYAGPTAPTGFLLCDGTAVSRSTYAALYAAIGTAYGAGDGSTTFALPDMRGRAIVGAGIGSGLSTRANGDTGGEETHLLVTGEIPSHAHGAGTASVNGTLQIWDSVAARAGIKVSSTTNFASGTNVRSALPSDSTVSNSADTGYQIRGNTANSGGGGAHENMPPFAVATYIIKT